MSVRFQENGQLRRKPGSGRSKHASFSTHEKQLESLEVVEDLKGGEHLCDAAQHLHCSERTIQRYAKKNGCKFRVSPKQDVNARQPVIKKKRLAFAERHLRSRGRLSNTLANATTLDHKWMHLYSQNKQHSLQFRLRGSPKPLRAQLKSTNDPKVHVMFAANANGTELFFHAKTRPLKSGKNKGMLIVESINVNGKEIARAFREKLGKFMHDTKCPVAFMDAVCVNHCPAVREELDRQGLRRVPSAGKGHNVEGGSPPVSHDTSILDGNLFATLQTEASRMTLKLPKDPKKSKTVQLMEVTEKLWKSEKYQKKAREAMQKLPHTLKAIVASNGGPTGR